MEIEIIIFAVIVIAVMGYKLYEFYKDKEVRENVHWCITGKFNRDGMSELLFAVRRAQSKDSIAEKYRISDCDDTTMLINLLKFFQNNLMGNYIKGFLFTEKCKYAISEEVQFFYWLFDFLKRNQSDIYSIYTEIYNNTDFEQRAKFKTVYNKLYYIAYSFCLHNGPLKSNKNFCFNERELKFIKDEINNPPMPPH